jgi:two-component system, OmpR family, response regulator PhoP
MKFGPFTLDVEKCTVQRDEGLKVGLTPFETTILQTLARNPGQTVLREEIETAMYDGRSALERPVRSPNSNGLEVMIRRIRTKLDPQGEIGLIVTVRGRGYALRHWPEEKVEQAA